jgi:poly-gamma-glutamate synthesis protein (capsule biosynthesis protein)
MKAVDKPVIKLFFYIYFLSFFSLNGFEGTENVQIPFINFNSQGSCDTVTFLAVGDYMTHMPQTKAAFVDSLNTYDFTYSFEYIQPLIQSVDFAMLNFETVCAGKPYSGYPRFSAPDEAADCIKRIGFDIAFTANNHCVDKGKAGIEKTIGLLKKNGIKSTGTFLDSTDRAKRNILWVEKDGIRAAFLNYTYGTNGYTAAKPVIINLIDTNIMKIDILNARKGRADAICVFIHWGEEYQRRPNDAQKRIADFCFNNGVDIIIGSHPHVVQPIESREISFEGKKKQVFAAYSLGNFISNQRWRFSDGGIVLNFSLIRSNNSSKATICNLFYTPFWVWKDETTKKRYKIVLENQIDSLELNTKDKKNALQFFDDIKKLIDVRFRKE